MEPQIDIKITEAETSVNIEQQHLQGGCGMVDVELDNLVSAGIFGLMDAIGAFDRATLWHTGDFNDRRHMIICGSLAPIPVDVQAKERWLQDTPAFHESLEALQLSSISELLSLYSGQKRDLRPWLQGAVVNRDWAMRLEHLAGRAFGYRLSEEIFETITGYRVFPEDLFVNVPQTAEALWSSFDLQ